MHPPLPSSPPPSTPVAPARSASRQPELPWGDDAGTASLAAAPVADVGVETADAARVAAAEARAVTLRDRESGAVRRALADAAREGLATGLIGSPIGDLLAIAGPDALHGLWFLDAGHGLASALDATRPGGHWIARTRDELDAYFAGTRHRFDVPLAPRGTSFQQDVWRRLLSIECGTTTSYGTIARDLGRPNAFRAVGLAVGRNPISILVPCHRVIGESGSLTGYAGGLPRKRFLLGLELGAETLAIAAR